MQFFEIAMLNWNGRAEQDFWSLAADEWPNPQLDFIFGYRTQVPEPKHDMGTRPITTNYAHATIIYT